MAFELSTSKDCRSAYREILQGYTYCEERNFYIKHFKESDLGFIDNVYKKLNTSTIVLETNTTNLNWKYRPGMLMSLI